MKLFITGGAGFIGINFVQHWLNKHPKDEITIYDKLTQYANVNEVMELSHSNSNLSLVIDDLLNFPRLQDLIRNYDVVVHFAAETHVDDSIKNPKLFIDTNVLGTSNLLLSTIGTDIEKIIYVSTDEVFGQSDTDEFNEHTSVNPRNPYSATKASAEMLAMAYHNTYKVPFIITNAVNNYGPHQYPNKLIPKFILRSLNNLSLPVYGDGKQQREWLYVTDHCRAIEYIIEKGDIGNRYCIGTGYKKENIEIVNEILTKTGRDATLIEHIIDRPGHDKDSAKIIIAGGIGITPFVELIRRYGGDKTYLFYCNRYFKNAVYHNEFEKILGKQYFDLISREKVSVSDCVLNCRFSLEVIKQLLPEEIYETAKLFVCGSPQFVDGITETIENGGINAERIFFEDLGY